MPRSAARRSPRRALGPGHPDIKALREGLTAYMDQQGLRSTGQRRLICEVFFEGGDHITLDELLTRVRAKNPSVGYATVYRTMKMLVQSGVAHESRFSEGVTRYELRDVAAHHDHLICIECGKIVEFKEPRIEELQEQVALRHGFQLRHHKLELYCVCATCRDPHRPRRR
jgi:Fur family transcriptional regulator, ferric uptake regulator